MSEVGTPNRQNAVPEFSVFKDEYTITSGMNLAINHGLPTTPRFLFLRLKCLTAEQSYAVGDEVELTNSSQVTASSNKTQIKVVFAALPTIVSLTDNSVNAITAANWTLVIKAEF